MPMPLTALGCILATFALILLNMSNFPKAAESCKTVTGVSPYFIIIGFVKFNSVSRLFNPLRSLLSIAETMSLALVRLYLVRTTEASSEI